MSTFAPLQFLKSAQNPLVWTAVDNGTDTRTSLIIYYGAANTLPSDTGMYEVNCIMMHQAEKQLYSNTGTLDTPNWEAFGPGSALPQPLVPGSFLFTDGATVYWATQLVGQVQYNGSNLNTYGILNFNSLLVASNDVPNSRINVDLDVVALAGDATFISTLEGNLDLANIGGFLDLSTQVTGQLSSTNIDITNLESTLDLGNISGQIDLTTQVTGQLPAANIDISDLESNLDLGNIGGFIDLTTQVTGLLPAANIDVADLITQLNDNVAVAVDGVTITGDGTTGNPLTATGVTGSFAGTAILPIGKYNSSGPTGNQFAYATFTESNTGRLYVQLTNSIGANSSVTALRIFRNQFGSYYEEGTVQVAKTDLTDTTGTSIDQTSWTTDGTYLYAVVAYERKTGSSATYYKRIDVIRYNLDGTSPTATNIYALVGPTAPSTGDSANWDLTSGGGSSVFGSCIKSSNELWITYLSGGTNEIRSFTISGTTYTPLNTYTVTSTPALTSSNNLSYDNTNNVFYVSGVDSSSPVVEKWTVSGSNFDLTTTQTYDEFYYGTNTTSGSYPSNVVDKSTYNQIFVVQDIMDTTNHAYWLMTYNFPKF